MTTISAASPYPSVDRLMQAAAMQVLVERYGRTAAVDAVRAVLDAHRARKGVQDYRSPSEAGLIEEAEHLLAVRIAPKLRPVFNMTGTILHTNLGRAVLSEAAVVQATMAMRSSCNLEYDIGSGGRGERDSLVEDLLIELTGAEAGLVVNNNAAAVLLVLAALAAKREVVVSRGELVEIGGSFRIPDVMRSAQAKLVEVGTTNRTHRSDFEAAIGPRTAALMKVHASNFEISGFVSSVADAELAAVAHERGLACIVDLGAGSLIDMAQFGLPREPIVADAIAGGADLVTFSGDKLLGGPQAGLIVGRKALIDKIRRHPLKRALRVSKITLAALEATLLAYRSPDTLSAALPTFRAMTRSNSELEAMGARMLPIIRQSLGDQWTTEVVPSEAQVGSGTLPSERISSRAIVIRPNERRAGAALKRLSAALRDLPTPVVGRVSDNALWLDLRCLEDEAGFATRLERLVIA